MQSNYKNKPINMVIVHAYPVNETLSKGIIEYLNQYFTVHFINLPGFHPTVPAVQQADFDGMVAFVEKSLKELALDHYILAGISFGFSIVNNVKVDENCLAILGSGPFLGHNFLRFTRLKKLSRILLIQLILKFRFEKWLWKNRGFRVMLSHLMGNKNQEMIQVLLQEVDPKTFFSMGLEILRFDRPPKFQNVPYILLMSPYDSVVNFNKTLDAFWKGVDTDLLRVILTDTPHYPENPSYEYFKQTFTTNEISSLFNFVGHVSQTNPMQGMMT